MVQSLSKNIYIDILFCIPSIAMTELTDKTFCESLT